MGNICRSPTAEAVMRKLVAARNLSDHITIDSAGTINYHVGNPPDPRMTAAAAQHGYKLTGAARHFTTDDFTTFDLIIAMDRDNLYNIRATDPDEKYTAKIKLLSDFLPPDNNSEPDVPDPYYGGDQGFHNVIEMIEQACPSILDHLLTINNTD